MSNCKNKNGDYVSPICGISTGEVKKYRYKTAGNDSHIVSLCEGCAKNLREDLHSHEELIDLE